MHLRISIACCLSHGYIQLSTVADFDGLLNVMPEIYSVIKIIFFMNFHCEQFLLNIFNEEIIIQIYWKL